MTAAVSARAVSRPWQLSAEALAVMEKFPPRPVPPSWDATAADRSAVVRRMLAPPFPAGDAKCRHSRKLAMLKILDWLELHPGTTWQERWIASGAGTGGTADWRDRMLDDLEAAGSLGPRGRQIRNVLGLGMVQLIGGDVLRPGLPWLLATASPVRVAEEMGRTRDPAGVAVLKELRETSTVGKSTFAPAIEQVRAHHGGQGRPGQRHHPRRLHASCWTAAGRCSATGPAPTGTARSSTSSCTQPGSSRPERRPRSG